MRFFQKYLLPGALFFLPLVIARAGQAPPVSADTVPQTVQRLPGKRLKALLDVGRQRLREQRFYEAEPYFREALAVDDQRAIAHFYLAESKRHRFRYAEALVGYQTALRLDATLAEAAFYHALMLKHTGAYRAAQQAFEDFVNDYQTSDQPRVPSLIQRAQAETEGILLAYRLFRQPTPEFSFYRLPSPVNSAYHDFAALPWQHDSSLLISSARPRASEDAPEERYGTYRHNFWWLQKQVRWQQQPLPARLTELNIPSNEGSGAFNQIRDQFYFTACDQDSTCRIMRSSLLGESWTNPVALSELINHPGYNTKHPAFSPGGDTLYFASDRPGGYGQFDLWMSVRTDETWQPPVNLGAPINTAFHEVSPAYFTDERALVFSSNVPAGLGGYDLYVAYGTHVTNLGFPFNSSQDDWYLRLGAQQAFLTSNRESKDGNFDVYTFRIQADTIHALARLCPKVEEDWYALQFGNADLFSEEDFYHQLPYADKVKVNQYVSRRAFREVLIDQLNQSGDESYRYETLSEQDQQLVRRLARAKRQFLLREPTEDLSEEDQRYYERLSPAERAKIAHLVDERVFRMLLQERSTIDPEAAYFYEALPTEDQQKIDRAVANQRTFFRQTLAQQPTLEDLFYYQSLPEAEKIELSRTIAAQRFLEKAWSTQQPDDDTDFVYQSLSMVEQQRVERYIQRRSFQQAVTESATLSASEQQYYEKLSSDDQEVINRLARAKKQFLLREPTDATSSDDQQFYERLPAEEQELVARIVDARVFSLLATTDAPVDEEADATFAQLSPRDQERIGRVINRKKVFHQRTFEQLPTTDAVFTYQKLSEEDKGRVGRMAGARQFTTREPSLASLDEDAKRYFEALPRSDQASIRRLAGQRKQFLVKASPDSLSDADYYFLETLPAEDKVVVRRIIDALVLDEMLTEEAQSVQLAFRYQNLSEPEKQRVRRLAQSRRLFEKLPERDTSTPPDQFYVEEIADEGTERVTLRGRLTARQGEFPAKVFLVSEQNDTLATATVDAAGGFTFSNIAYQESDRVAFQRPSQSFTTRSDYELAELTVVPLADKTDTLAHFSNIYFATNQHTLPTGAMSTLDSLAAFHRQHPAVPIEVRAFADSTGARRYNELLTQRRARSVHRYLLAQGISAQRLSQLAMGPVPGDDLAHCRRAELLLGASPGLPQSARVIYIIQPQPKLRPIAERYNLSLEALKGWNGGKESLAPYTPVRVVLGAE